MFEREKDSSTDRIIVVFKVCTQRVRQADTQDKSSIKNVLDDPKHRECIFRSSYSRNPSTMIELQVTYSPNPSLVYVWVKVTGKRFDSSSRSASPSLVNDDGGWTDEAADTRVLPQSLLIYAAPRWIKRGEAWVWRAQIVDRPLNLFREQFMRTGDGRKPIFLDDIGLSRRFSEKEVSKASMVCC